MVGAFGWRRKMNPPYKNAIDLAFRVFATITVRNYIDLMAKFYLNAGASSST